MKSINQPLKYTSVAVALLINCNCFGTDPLGQNLPNNGSATIQTETLEKNAMQGGIAAVKTLGQRALEKQQRMRPDLAWQALARLARNAPQENVRSAAIRALRGVQSLLPSVILVYD